MNVLDPRYVQGFTSIEKEAERQGRDRLELLNNFGLLATPKVLHDTEIRTLESLYRRLENTSAAAILAVYTSRGSGTPEAMFQAILEWLEAVINAMAKGDPNVTT
jgi:hypothetical protein